jgi:squalene-associated FAD-dependent desaturase
VKGSRVVVVGGGLAGLSAALACVDAGASVRLLERRPRLGGATWSFERHGAWFDNGQHVFLRCCTAYRDFLARIGSSDGVVLQDRLSIPVIAPGRPVELIARDALPAPLHLARSLLGYGHLTRRERWCAVRTALRLRRLDPGAPELDERSFGDWLVAQGESPGAIEGLWDLIARPTLNLPAQDASLALAAMVFRTGLLSDRGAADIGYARVPLASLHASPAARALRTAGASIHMNTAVAGIARDADGAVCGVDLDDGHVVADAVVLAVPHPVAAALLPNGAVPDSERLPQLGESPIVNVHVVFDRRVTELELAAGVGTPVQWVFDRTRPSGIEAGQCLAVSLSAADEQIGRPAAELSDGIVDALRELFPAARGARVIDTIVTRERAATFRAVPGTGRLRPPTRTAVPGLYLAGAWTDTGWPATMEGAVRSGTAAAAALVADLGASTWGARAVRDPQPEPVVA